MAENIYFSQNNSVRSRDTKIIVCWIIIIFLVVANVFALGYLKRKQIKAYAAQSTQTNAAVSTTPKTMPSPKSSSGKEVLVSFDTAELPVDTVGREIKLNVLVNSGDNRITGGGITVNYSAALQFNLEKTRDQATNADTICKKLPQVLSITDVSGEIRITKVSIEADSKLPTSGFCFATLFFTIKSQTLNQDDTIAFGGRLNEVKDWDFVGTSSRLPIKTGSPIKLTTSSTPGKPSPTPTPQCSNKNNGDANCDGQITNEDFTIYLVEYMAQTQGVLDIHIAKADFNNDTLVDSKDFDILIKNLSTNATPTPTVIVTSTISPTPSATTPSVTPTVTSTPMITSTPKCTCIYRKDD